MKKTISLVLISLLLCGLLTASVGASVSVSYDQSIKVLLHFDGNITDAIGSTTWTAHNGATVSSTQYKFGGSSLYVKGSRYIDAPDSPNFYFPGDFTIDFWVYRSATGSSSIWRLFGQSDSSGSASSRSVDSAFYLDQLWTDFCGSSCVTIHSTQTIPGNTWTHIAIVRSGDTFMQFVNGTMDGSTTSSGFAINNATSVFTIGKLGLYPYEYMNGYIDEFRISDEAVWTENFAVPTSAYAEITPTPTVVPTSTPFGDGLIPLAYQGNLHLFILAGQSNMVGNFPASDAGTQVTSPTIFNFGNNYRWSVGIEPIDSQIGQVDPVSLDGAGYGPGMSFGLRLQEIRPGYVIGLIPCAKSGSTIEQWQQSYSEDTLYGSCLKRIRAASTMGTIEGIIFYQGESEASSTAAFTWGENFTELVADWRSDIGDPNLPIVFVQIDDLPSSYPYTSVIQAQQAAISIDNVIMVSAIGLARGADGIHLLIGSEQALGVMLANAMDSLLVP